MPVGAFAPADVVDLYLHQGAFETVLADEDQESAEPAQPAESRSYGPRQFARPSFTGGFAGSAFSLKKGSLLVRMWEAESYSLIGSGPQRSK